MSMVVSIWLDPYCFVCFEAVTLDVSPCVIFVFTNHMLGVLSQSLNLGQV